MLSHKGRFDPTRFEDLTVTVEFHCHSACRFCIVQEGMNRFRGVSEEKLRQAVEDNARSRRYRRVCFTGGEVTLEKKLFDYVAIARESKSFEHVRLQTNGRLLADMAFARRLVDAGIDEYFVSLHGHDAATQDDISQRQGSFDEAMRGIANLAELGVCLMTNTVICSLNVEHLAEIVDTVAPHRPVRMEFWNYLPMEDYTDERNLIAPMSRVAPELRRALAKLRASKTEARVKYVPRCLLGEFADAHDDAQPDVVIAEKFYDPYPQFACIHEARCEHSDTCLGLHHPYITKLGWEETALRPTPRTRPFVEPEDGPWIGSDEPGKGRTGLDALDHPAWRSLVAGVADKQGASLAAVRLTRRTCCYVYEHGASSVEVVLTARDDTAPALVRTPSFNIHYRSVSGPDRDRLSAIVRDVVAAVRQRDPGGMKLDRRKGLVGAEAERRRTVRSGDAARPVIELRERGYTVFDRLYGEADVARLQATMKRLHAEAGSPDCYAPEPVAIAPETEVSTTGLVFYKFLNKSPEDAGVVVHAEVIAAIRGYLGNDVKLEVAGAVIADAHRPFFSWHTHIGGPDDSRYRREKIFPRFEAPERVMTLLYLDDLDDDNGPLLVLPRRVTDPTPPPHDLEALEWPGQAVLKIRRGSVVVLDQCTWHAVRRKTTPGIRSFIGCYFKSPRASATQWVDDSLARFEGGGPLLQSVLPR